MYNKFNLKSHKELFEKLYHPFDKLEILFEVFFDIMVVMAVAAAVSGAASALQQYLGWNYYVNIVIVGAIILCLTIFVSLARLCSFERQGYAKCRLYSRHLSDKCRADCQFRQ